MKELYLNILYQMKEIYYIY